MRRGTGSGVAACGGAVFGCSEEVTDRAVTCHPFVYRNLQRNQTTPTANNRPAAAGTARPNLVNRIRRSSVSAKTTISTSSAAATPHRKVAALYPLSARKIEKYAP